MKQRLFFLAMTMFLFVATAFAQTYDADMDVLLSGLESKNSNLTMLSSQFESLQQSDPSRWEASYYFVFSKILIAMNEKNGENIDRLLDDVQSVLTKLIAGHPKESEFQVLQGWLYQARISVSPMSRGMEYTQKANASFANAITLDENNPRAYYLQGMGTFYMPRMFGGGSKNALVFFQKAKEKFAIFKPVSKYSPHWGESNNQQMLELCKKDENKQD